MSEVNVDKRLTQVEKKLDTVADDLGKLTTFMSELGAIQKSQGERFDILSLAFDHEREKRSTPEWTTKTVLQTLASAMVTITIVVSTLMWVTASYIDMRIGDSEGLAEWRVDKDEFQREMHHEVGKFRVELEAHGAKLDHFDKLDHMRDDKIRELEKAAAANDVKSRAIGEYVKELHAEVQSLRKP